VKTENLYNERRRERLFGVSLKFELGMMKDEVSASSFFFFYCIVSVETISDDIDMEQTFNTSSYLQHIAEELIRNFAFAGQATTPGLVGGAREKTTRHKLETLLPPMVGVGTGCIIDSYGNTSKQMDIVVYEKNICPIYSINDTPETTYFPCEGVIAVGEIKSTLNNKELEDIFAKVNSVKQLRRYAIPSKSQLSGEEIVSFRHYGTLGAWDCYKEEEFNQDEKRTDQIFCFAFCGELNVKPETLLETFTEELKKYPKNNSVNLISILNYGLVLFMNRQLNQVRYWYGDDTNSLYVTSKRENNFQFLINRLIEVIRSYRTTETSSFSNYINKSAGQILLDGTFKDLPNSSDNLKS
jgi:hypothetical protein